MWLECAQRHVRKDPPARVLAARPRASKQASKHLPEVCHRAIWLRIWNPWNVVEEFRNSSKLTSGRNRLDASFTMAVRPHHSLARIAACRLVVSSKEERRRPHNLGTSRRHCRCLLIQETLQTLFWRTGEGRATERKADKGLQRHSLGRT
eukprot:scaffold8264_cov372-Pinguiococcus_pyrenoidosus.AAC.1